MVDNSEASSDVFIAFDQDLVELELDQIIPVKMTGAAIINSSKFKQISSSIKEVGLIEPLVVGAPDKSTGKHILLDGHLRLAVLKSLETMRTKTTCIVSLDDEAYTYNKHINRISPIQEHRMILRAVKRGVTEEKIAKALNLEVRSITRKKKLLKGITSEASEMLKDKMVGAGVFPALRLMKPTRQIEAVTLMDDAGIYSVAYARALLAATPNEQLCKPDKPKSVPGLSIDQMARMENEMGSLQREYKLIEETYGKDVLNHTVARSYLSSLLSNAKVVKYLARNHSEMLSEFQKITEEV